jgi:lipopolysaccharide transport system permease protein
MQERVYRAESNTKHPRILFREMFQDLRASVPLARQLVKRNIVSQYRESLLGPLWAFIPAMVTAALVILANRANVIRIGNTDIPYPAYVTFSMMLWQTFVEALNAPLTALKSDRAMLTKLNFPVEALILTKLGEVLFSFAIRLILIIGLFLFYQVSIGWNVFLAPFTLCLLILLGTSFGLVLGPFSVVYQDISRGLVILTGFWLLATPVLYPTPEKSLFAVIVKFNPVTPILVSTRELATHGNLSDPHALIIGAVFTVLCLSGGWFAFRLALPIVTERMGT